MSNASNNDSYIPIEEAEIYGAIAASDDFEIEPKPIPDEAIKQAEALIDEYVTFIGTTQPPR